MYFNPDVLKFYDDKNHILLINKTDLGLKVYSYSTIRTVFELDFNGSVCLIGYPNVGKSSKIN